MRKGSIFRPTKWAYGETDLPKAALSRSAKTNPGARTPWGKEQGKAGLKQAELRKRIIEKTTREKPDNATHWSTRSLAEALNTTHSFVHRVWQSVGLKPHLEKTFKVSNDPHFEEKLCDVVGLYLDPPENAVVFCVDEKTSIQALDRTQPGLPLKKGRCGTVTHDY